MKHTYIKSTITLLACLLAGAAAAVNPAPSVGTGAALAKDVAVENSKAKAENDLITQAQTALNAHQWQSAETALKKLVALDPARWEYNETLGNVEYQQGKYEDALQAYELALQPAQQVKGSEKTAGAMADMLLYEGNIYLKLKRNDDAVAAFTRAAETAPNPATAWFNLCATLYNIGKMDAVVPACDKAIAANPSKADAYFIKGSALFGNGNIDANNKFIVPDGTVDALRTYLKLAPAGSHAADVKAMLDALNGKF